jgi:hypothetical protein
VTLDRRQIRTCGLGCVGGGRGAHHERVSRPVLGVEQPTLSHEGTQRLGVLGGQKRRGITVAGICPTYTIQNRGVSTTRSTPSQEMPLDSEPLCIMMLSSVMS